MSETLPLPLLSEPVLGRCCWSCAHIHFFNSHPDWSDVTPGYDFDLWCTKGYWLFDANNDSLETFGTCLQSASRCADFEPHAGV